MPNLNIELWYGVKYLELSFNKTILNQFEALFLHMSDLQS